MAYVRCNYLQFYAQDKNFIAVSQCYIFEQTLIFTDFSCELDELELLVLHCTTHK